MGGLAGCRGGGGGLSLVVSVSEKPNLVSEKSGKSQGILFICDAGNPVYACTQWDYQDRWSVVRRWRYNLISVEKRRLFNQQTNFLYIYMHVVFFTGNKEISESSH